MFQTFKNAFTSPDIRKKMLYTFILILIYRIGCFIPIPGLDINSMGLANLAESNDFYGMLSTITGNSFQNGTLFALGILPFINSFIIMQLLTLIIPKLEQLSKDGEDGRKKITQYTRYIAILLAIIQAVGIVFAWKSYIVPVFGTSAASSTATEAAKTADEVFTMIFIIIILTGGSSIVMWLGERITEYGIGNGTSLIIFIGIISTLGSSIGDAIIKTIPNEIKSNNDTTGIWILLGFLIMLVALFLVILYVDMAERKVMVQYAKRVKGNKIYGGQTTYIPIKVNSGGVMPIIFASSLILFPTMIISFIGAENTGEFGVWWTKWMGSNGYLYPLFMFILIIFFSYFYAQIQFNPDDIARMLQKNGGFMPGVRPGKPTSDRLRKINNRLVLFGALFLAFVALVPTLILQYVPGFDKFNFNNAFSATGLLIVVSVALEFQKALESQLLVKNNKGFLK